MQRKVLVLVIALSVAFGAAAVAATDHASVEVAQEPNEPATVTVVDSGGQAVENASLTVESVDENVTYDGTGDYTTDRNGTVELPAPNETVDILVTATVDNETVSTEATLEYRPELDLSVEGATGQPATVTLTADGEPADNATIDVGTIDENATYDGTGTYETDANGTVELPVPNETVDVNVSAEYRGASTSAEATLTAPPDLAVAVDQDRGRPATVTVLADDKPAENATIDVETVDENATYAGTDAYETDENGTVELPTPEETVAVSVAAEFQGASDSTETELKAAPELNVSLAQDGPGLPATVTVLADDKPAENTTIDVETVDENTTYAGTGAYETDDNGTVELPAPNETVEVTVTASYQGAEETVTDTVEGIDAIDESLPFGQQLQLFKATLEDDNRTGREIASWVTENNPGNAPDHAGPKDDDRRGPPDHAGGDGDRNGEDGEDREDGSDEAGDGGTDTEDGGHKESNAGGNGNSNAGGNGGGPPGNSGNR
jgi:uncharacterized GH25 family protein